MTTRRHAHTATGEDRLFPADFAWGTATAAYQIEGGCSANGKGASIWDQYSHEPGRIGLADMWQPANGDIACDHYNRWPEDVALIRALGTKAYRLSLSWARILPLGFGKPNPDGLSFYRSLLSALCEAGVTPWVTLYHWDLPLALQQRGGWSNPDIVGWFSDYADLAVREFGDLVSHWITFNEPQCFVWMGLGQGSHAPGLKLPISELIRCGHHVLKAHGKAVEALRAGSTTNCRIGYAPVGLVKIPHTTAPGDCEAARAAMFSTPSNSLWTNAWWYDPVFLGHYPEDGLTHFERMLPTDWERDLAIIHQPLDFLGTNIYTGQRIQAGPDGTPTAADYPVGSPLTAFKWTIAPEALYWGPRWYFERYKLPVFITENGMSNPDWVHEDGTVPDPQRIEFTRRHLRELRRAISEGTAIQGYFHWSLLDNFEWAEGYKERFGLVHVDFSTGKRTPKNSFYWYRDVIKSRGGNLELQLRLYAESPRCQSA